MPCNQLNQVAQCLVQSVQKCSQLAGGDGALHVFVCTNKKRKVSNTVQEKGTQQVQAAERHGEAKSEEIKIGKV